MKFRQVEIQYVPVYITKKIELHTFALWKGVAYRILYGYRGTGTVSS
jgi:hypothetical protein